MNRLGLAPSLEDSYRRRIVSDLQGLSGARFERFGYVLMDRICSPSEMLHRGTNLEGAPVKKVVDSVSVDTLIAAQYSSESAYFAADAQKPKADYEKVRDRHKGAQTIHLIANDDAPVNVTNFLEWAKTRGERDGVRIETWDARRIADFIIDNLHEESFTATVGQLLPAVDLIRSEYAFSQMLPRLSVEYVYRPEESDLCARVRTTPVTVLFGLSGIGKSDLACAVAWEIRSEFELVAWVDARLLAKVEDLRSFSLHRYGAPQNIIGLAGRNRVLLILDNLETPINFESLAAELHPASRLLITQKTSTPVGVSLDGMDEPQARQLLEYGGESCPDSLLASILKSTGGHPLTLKLLNRLSRRFGWSEISAELSSLGDLLDSQTQAKLRDRVLGRIEGLISTELDFVRWCGTAEVDYGLARHVLGIGGISNLQELSVLARSTDDFLRFHEIVFTFLGAKSVDTTRSQSFTKMLVAYLQKTALSKQAPFLVCAHRHRQLISRLVEAGAKSPALLYAYFISNEPENVLSTFVSDLTEFARAVIEDFSDVPMRLRLVTVIEATEREFLRLLRIAEAKAKAFVSSTIDAFDWLLSKATAADDLALIKHHKAKALNRSGSSREAETLFREIVNGPRPLPQSRLQLARILERRAEGKAAAEQIRSILDQARAEPNSVSTTIMLEVFGTLRHRHLLPFRDEFAAKYSDIAADEIEATISSGFEQPYFALAALAGYWSEHDPEMLTRLFKSLPPPPPALMRTDGGKACIAEIDVHVAALVEGPDSRLADSLRAEAIELMSRIARPNQFYDHLKVRALIGRKEYEEALRVLDSDNATDNTWHHVWRACVEHALGHISEARLSIERAKSMAEQRGIRLWTVEKQCRELFDIS